MNHVHYLEQNISLPFFKDNYSINSCLCSNYQWIVFSCIIFIPYLKIQLTSPLCCELSLFLKSSIQYVRVKFSKFLIESYSIAILLTTLLAFQVISICFLSSSIYILYIDPFLLKSEIVQKYPQFLKVLLFFG